MSLQYDLHEIVEGSDVQMNFSTLLLKLIFKADLHNKELLRKGFPNAVSMVEKYRERGIIQDLKYD
ncbi:hypothetical protein MUP77_22740 [Candidatus Bathyarchaeota archaeon]|nr:hypothetical protein [Candidatus Bathyarchaeota archaeon]